MPVRTRMAIMVILLLLGCVFSAPFYRNPTSDTGKLETPNASANSLQWQGRPNEPKDQAMVRRPLAVSRTSSSEPKRLVSEPVAKPISVMAPFPALTLPPPLSVDRQRSSASSARKRLPVRPVTRISDDEVHGTSADPGSADPGSADPGKGATPKRSHRPQPNNLGSEVEERWHRIVNGDTLERLSVKYYGHPSHALFLFEANRRTLVSPKILPLGRELVIPRSPPKTLAAAQVPKPVGDPSAALAAGGRDIGWRSVNAQ